MVTTSWGWAEPSSDQASLRLTELKIVFDLDFRINISQYKFLRNIWYQQILKLKTLVVFHFQKIWGRLPFPEKLRLSANSWKFEVVFHILKLRSSFIFLKKLRSSSICFKTEIVFQFLKNWDCLPFCKN